MKKHNVLFCYLLLFSLFFLPKASCAAPPKPFDLEIGQVSYQDVLSVLQARKWNYQEYEKKQSKQIGKQDSRRGKNTFFKATPKRMEGARSIMLFFNNESTLDALILMLYLRL